MSLFTVVTFALSPILRHDEIFIAWDIFSIPSSCMTRDATPNAPKTYLATLIFDIIRFVIIKTKWNKELWFLPPTYKHVKSFHLGQWWLLCNKVQGNYLYSYSCKHPYQKYGLRAHHCVKVGLLVSSLAMGFAEGQMEANSIALS